MSSSCWLARGELHSGSAMNDRERKDRLIQTRVPESLESALKREATRRRLGVSQLVRNILEDTLHMVGGVVDGVDAIVQDSIALGREVGRGVAKVRRDASGRSSETAAADRDDEPEPTPDADPVSDPQRDAPADAESATDAVAAAPAAAPDDLTDVFAWHPVVLNRAAHCARCGTAMPAGHSGYVAMRDDPSRPRVWSCSDCVARLGG